MAEFLRTRPKLQNRSYAVQKRAYDQHLLSFLDTQQKSTTRHRVVNVPVSMGTVSKSIRPKVVNERNGIRVRNTEIISSVAILNSAFNLIATYEINPGNTSIFSWLSTIANSWEFYQFHTLTFRWVPSVGTATSGNLMMAFDADSTDASPSNLKDMMSYSNAVATNLWKSATIQVDTKDLHRRKSYFTGVSGGQDANLRNVGELIIASTASDAITSAGYIEVSYDITFETPQKYIPPSLQVNAVGPEPFGSSRTVIGYGGMAEAVRFKSGTTADILRAGKYLLWALADGSSPNIGTLTSPSGNVAITQLSQLTGASNSNQVSTYLINALRPGTVNGNTTSDLSYLSGSGTISDVVWRLSPFHYS